MKLADVIGALRRRWYIVLTSILLAVGAASFAWTTVPPQYERSGTQLLLPGLATIPEDANPYLYVGGLYQIADVIVRAVGPEDISAAVQEYPGTEVAVTRDQAAGAVVIVTVTASSDEAATAVLDDMLVVTEETLQELQDDQSIPDNERVSFTPLTKSAESVVVQKTRMLVTALAGIGVLVLGAGITMLVDNLLRSRRRAHRSTALPDVDDDGVAPVDVAAWSRDSLISGDAAPVAEPVAPETAHPASAESESSRTDPKATATESGGAQPEEFADQGESEFADQGESESAVPVEPAAEPATAHTADEQPAEAAVGPPGSEPGIEKLKSGRTGKDRRPHRPRSSVSARPPSGR
jgi:hypothetical protein